MAFLYEIGSIVAHAGTILPARLGAMTKRTQQGVEDIQTIARRVPQRLFVVSRRVMPDESGAQNVYRLRAIEETETLQAPSQYYLDAWEHELVDYPS